MKYRLFFCAMPLVLGSLTGCGGAATVASAPQQRIPRASFPDQLAQGRARWAAKGLRSYTFTLQVRCFCLREDTYPVKVTVREGVSDATERFPSFDTIEKAFDKLDAAYAQNAHRLDVHFSSDGWPSTAIVDPRADTVDDEYELTIKDVRPL